MRKTVAVLGDTGDFCPEVMGVLMKQDLRLLFVSEDEEQNRKIKSKLKTTNAEVEFITCEREGCWEADIIVIAQPEKASGPLLKKISEVATQKIVLVLSEIGSQPEIIDLQQILPNSKVVEILIDLQQKEISMTGNDRDAKAGVQELFEKAGYQIL